MESNQILQVIEQSPIAQEILAQRRLETLEKRRILAKQLDDLQIEYESIPQTDDATADLRVDLSLARAKVKTLETEIAHVERSLFRKREEARHKVTSLEGELIESADPEINRALEFFRDKMDYIGNPSRIVLDRASGERDLVRWTETKEKRSNLTAIAEALGYCRRCVRELESMKLFPEPDLRRIERMKREIPPIDDLAGVMMEKPMEKGPEAPRPMSDSEWEWTVGRLLKKAGDFLRR
jgi:hypothetical protein